MAGASVSSHDREKPYTAPVKFTTYAPGHK